MASSELLSYKSVCLYKEDADLLQEGQWLNDIIITFWLEVLENRVGGGNNILFMHPATAFMLRFEKGTTRSGLHL
jgi:hypothetical protein